jgi:hypothetical protein
MVVSMDALASFRNMNSDTPLDQTIRFLKEDGVVMLNNLVGRKRHILTDAKLTILFTTDGLGISRTLMYM